MAYRSIYTYPPEQQEKIRARWRASQRKYNSKERRKEREEKYMKHWEEVFRREREAAQKAKQEAAGNED